MKWNFPESSTGENIGISGQGVEIFLGDKIKSLAREICQNSIDATIHDNNQVIVEFSKFNLNESNFPGLDDLRVVFRKGIDYWKDQKDQKAKLFYEKGLDLLYSNSIPCLRVSDFNTTGLQGVYANRNTSWMDLTKSSGVSDKNEISGGSFGIGKFAPFAASKLFTVFYNTINIDGEEAFQGVSRLTSFEIDKDKGSISTGLGFFGNNNNQPNYKSRSLDPNFCRKDKEYGTDIYILGFEQASGDNWHDEIIISVLDSFMYAIVNNQLKVIVGDTVLSSDTLLDFIFRNQHIITEEINEVFHSLTSMKTIWFEDDFQKMGLIKLGVLINDNSSQKVTRIRRNGMKIDSVKFHTPFMSHSAVLLVLGKQLNTFLRKLENPQHTKWEPGRSEQPKVARRILKNLNGYISNKLSELNPIIDQDSFQPIVSGFLNVSDVDSLHEETVEALPEEIKDISVRKSKIRISREEMIVDVEKSIDYGLQQGDVTLQTLDKLNSNHGTRSSDRGNIFINNKESFYIDHLDSKLKGKPKNIPLNNLRIFCTNKSEGEYVIQLEPSDTYENASLNINVLGENGKYPMEIINAQDLNGQQYSISNGNVQRISLTKNEMKYIRLKIDHDDYCTMEIRIYGNK